MSQIQPPIQHHQPNAPSVGSGPRYGQAASSKRSPIPGAVAAIAYLFVGIFSVGFMLAGAGIFGGIEANPTMRAMGFIGLCLVLTTAPITWALFKRMSGGGDERLSRSLEQLTDVVRRLDESSGLSPDARRVLNRRQERELLCRAIEEDIQAQAWDAAIVLCNELAERFGYRADAEEFRTRIELARAEVFERRLTDSIARLDGLIVQRRWDVALQESARIGRLFPESPRVENLRARVVQAQDVYKQDLERRFLDAAHEQRIDEAMGLLKELDSYLSETDAAPYQEVARGVVSKARENLGAQFKIAVQNRDWRTATLLGRRIINEFPNTRMAAEVRSMWDGILSKANATVVTSHQGNGEPMGADPARFGA